MIEQFHMLAVVQAGMTRFAETDSIFWDCYDRAALIDKASAEVREALKDLWMARHEWAKKNMFEIDREALRVYEVKEAAVLAALTTPTDLLMAAWYSLI